MTTRLSPKQSLRRLTVRERMHAALDKRYLCNQPNGHSYDCDTMTRAAQAAVREALARESRRTMAGR